MKKTLVWMFVLVCLVSSALAINLNAHFKSDKLWVYENNSVIQTKSNISDFSLIQFVDEQSGVLAESRLMQDQGDHWVPVGDFNITPSVEVFDRQIKFGYTMNVLGLNPKEVWELVMENRTFFYNCSFFFNYTGDHFWCYKKNYNLDFDHSYSFVNGSVFYWQEEIPVGKVKVQQGPEGEVPNNYKLMLVVNFSEGNLVKIDDKYVFKGKYYFDYSDIAKDYNVSDTQINNTIFLELRKDWSNTTRHSLISIDPFFEEISSSPLDTPQTLGGGGGRPSRYVPTSTPNINSSNFPVFVKKDNNLLAFVLLIMFLGLVYSDQISSFLRRYVK